MSMALLYPGREDVQEIFPKLRGQFEGRTLY